MQSDSQQEKLLMEINIINHKMDELFFFLDENTLTNDQSKMIHIQLDLISDSISEVLKYARKHQR
ncbi:hypothetical protein [Cytobacillus praedii]|uniref:Uncharacterized protein n=1 Tax=Cytobacillus praedii TaxID=1742358 RepID=A0A4V2NTP4_9BACI|nr:hypothetical protein [Cytobacillus praedii]TCJ01050.1 hypothetical protein E0Y62_25875 [Cytobacillus praedii]